MKFCNVHLLCVFSPVLESLSSLELPGLTPDFRVAVGDNHYTTVTVNVSHNTQTISSNTSEEYKDLFYKQYKCDKSVKLGGHIEHIQHINNRLICTLPNGITICSAESLETLESFTFHTISDANYSVVTDTGSYIVSSYAHGLCEVDSRGNHCV